MTEVTLHGAPIVSVSLRVTRPAMFEVGVSARMTSPLYSLTLSLSLPFRGEHRISKFHAFAFFPLIIKHCRPRKYTRANLDINTWLAVSISKTKTLEPEVLQETQHTQEQPSNEKLGSKVAKDRFSLYPMHSIRHV